MPPQGFEGQGLPERAVERARRQRRRSGVFDLLPRRSRAELAAAEGQAHAAILFLGHDVHAGRRLLPENRRLGFAFESGRPGAFHRAAERPVRSGEHSAANRESAGGRKRREREGVVRGRELDGCDRARAIQPGCGDWQVVLPVGQLSDAPKESYRIELPNVPLRASTPSRCRSPTASTTPPRRRSRLRCRSRARQSKRSAASNCPQPA